MQHVFLLKYYEVDNMEEEITAYCMHLGVPALGATQN